MHITLCLAAEYVVSTVKTIVPVLQLRFPEAHLCNQMASNKLAVCTGDGSSYDKHFDNSGVDDTRKVTIIYYLNENWRPECGGQFRIYNDGKEIVDINPVYDRLLVFWSDKLVHSVLPSFTPKGVADHRYALTIWLTTTTTSAILRDQQEILRHFRGA